MTFQIPIILPYGINGALGDCHIRIPIYKLRDLPKHPAAILNVTISIKPGHEYFLRQNIEQYNIDKLSERLLVQYRAALSRPEIQYTLILVINEDVTEIAKAYSAPRDIFTDIIFGLSNYFQSLLLLFGPIRLSPILVDEKNILFFNQQLAYLYNPWQIWFFEKETIDILNDENIFNEVEKSEMNMNITTFSLLKSFLIEWQRPLDINEFVQFVKEYKIDDENIINFSRTLSDVIRLNLSYDYSLIVGLLTAFIEKILKIDSEHTYKFKIKICNLLSCTELSKILAKIYGERSNFFHTAKYKKLNTIYDIMAVYLLLLILRKLLLIDMKQKINSNSFDFCPS